MTQYIKVSYDHLNDLINAFEEGVKFYTKVSHDTFTLINTYNELNRYQYRLYIKE